MMEIFSKGEKMKLICKLFLITISLLFSVGILSTNTLAHPHHNDNVKIANPEFILHGQLESLETLDYDTKIPNEGIAKMINSEGKNTHQKHSLSTVLLVRSLITSMVNEDIAHCPCCPTHRMCGMGGGSDCSSHPGMGCIYYDIKV